MAQTQTPYKCDKRSLRSQRMLRWALAAQIHEGDELSRVTVAGLTERAGLTRRTFYSHYRDIPDFVERVEDELLAGVRERIGRISAAGLAELYGNINALDPAPGSVELLAYLKENGEIISALLGPQGDPAFVEKLKDIARAELTGRMKSGLLPDMLGTFFDYYLSYVVSAELGVILRWFENGLTESPETLARIMTVIAFVRPGDLYGMPIDINVPAYGMKLMNLQLEEESHE